MMKNYNIKTINLTIYYLVVFTSLSSGILLALIITILIPLGSIGYAISCVLLSLIILQILRRAAYQNLKISISNKELKLKNKEEIIIILKKIKKYKTKVLWTKFPLFSVELNNGEKFKFRCKKNNDEEFERFITEFERVI